VARWLDRTAMLIALAGVSLPIYFTGLLAQALFCAPVGHLRRREYVNFVDNPLGWANKLFLAWVTLRCCSRHLTPG